MGGYPVSEQLGHKKMEADYLLSCQGQGRDLRLLVQKKKKSPQTITGAQS